jgi:hypothetical protein
MTQIRTRPRETPRPLFETLVADDVTAVCETDGVAAGVGRKGLFANEAFGFGVGG